MNKGLTPTEIAAEVDLPPSAANHWSCRGYYGTVSHNVRAVYQRYLGYFDGVPANLDPLPPAEAGRRYVELAGGAEALLAKAREAFEPRRLPLGGGARQPSRLRRPATTRRRASSRPTRSSRWATRRRARSGGTTC